MTPKQLRAFVRQTHEPYVPTRQRLGLGRSGRVAPTNPKSLSQFKIEASRQKQAQRTRDQEQKADWRFDKRQVERGIKSPMWRQMALSDPARLPVSQSAGFMPAGVRPRPKSLGGGKR